MTTPHDSAAAPRGAAGAIILLVLHALLALVLGVVVVIAQLEYMKCNVIPDPCTSGLINVSIYGYAIGAMLTFVATITLTVLRLVQRRTAWKIALIGIGATVLVFGAALALVAIGTPGV